MTSMVLNKNTLQFLGTSNTNSSIAKLPQTTTVPETLTVFVSRYSHSTCSSSTTRNCCFLDTRSFNSSNFNSYSSSIHEIIVLLKLATTVPRPTISTAPQALIDTLPHTPITLLVPQTLTVHVPSTTANHSSSDTLPQTTA